MEEHACEKKHIKKFFFFFLKKILHIETWRIQIKQMYFIIGNKIFPVLKWLAKIRKWKNDFLTDLDSKWNQASKDNNTLLAQNAIP